MNPAKLPTWLWAPRAIAAGVLLQTLYFKFTGAPESVYIFETLGVEPYGRILAGLAELLAAVLLLLRPRLGAALAALVMLAAIASHLGPLGIEIASPERGIPSDGGLLFGLALLTLLCSVLVLWFGRRARAA